MKYFREIVFTKAHLERAFRYKDLFQLLPYQPKWRKPYISKYVVDFPCVLEYCLSEEECKDVQQLLDKEREICILLTAFSIYRVFQYDIHASSWGVKIPFYCSDTESKRQLRRMHSQVSEFYYPMFFYPRIKKDLKITGFTEVPPEGMMVIAEHYQSYLHFEHGRFDVKREPALSFAKDTVRCLDEYYALNESSRKKVFSAARLITDSIELMDYRYSLSFLAAVASLETMADIADNGNNQVIEECGSCHSIKYSPYTCPKCGKYIWGVTTKVKEFLKTHVSQKEEDVANYNKIYNLRSKITHVGDIFTKDSIFKSTETREHQEFEMGYKAIAYARQALKSLMLK